MPSVMSNRTERRSLGRLPLAAAVIGLSLGGLGCTNVKGTLQNPQTGEVWTVHEHTVGSDTVSYCPPPHIGGPCRRARMIDGPPPVSPAAWANGQQPGYPGMGQPGPFGLPIPPGLNPFPNGQMPFPIPLLQQPQQQPQTQPY